jgi:hypothetical protein
MNVEYRYTSLKDVKVNLSDGEIKEAIVDYLFKHVESLGISKENLNRISSTEIDYNDEDGSLRAEIIIEINKEVKTE